tara:strand:+ start:29 stop:352 length:324 start_codon:yes stop_codon:yes gene_type:complete
MIKQKIKKQIYKKIKFQLYFLIFILITGLTNLVINDFGLKKLINLKQKQETLNINIQDLLSQQIFLQEEINRLKYDTSYIEKIAREKFMMVKPGEKVYRVIESKNIY